MRRSSFWLLLLFSSAGRVVGQSDQQAVGFVVAATAASLTPVATGTPLKVHAGDILFPGDSLATAAAGSVSFFYCPQSAGASAFLYTLHGKAVIGDQPGGLPGLSGSPAGICLIPAFERSPEVASIRAPQEILPNPPTLEAIRQQIAALEPSVRASLESLSRQDLLDPRLKLAFAVLLEKAGLLDEAAAQYLELAARWQKQPRLPKYAEKLRASRGAPRAIIQPTATPPIAAAPGKTYALVIGISKYEQPEKLPDLLFASRDAASFEDYLKTPRGGVPASVVLTDKAATSGAIRNSFNFLKTKAGKNDSIIVFVAAHGDVLNNIPNLITHRADPQDLSINSLPLSELQSLILGRTEPFRRALIFLDLCHAGHAGRFQLPPGKVAAPYVLMMATNESKNALAYEDEVFDRHGVFTYFLLRGLNTAEAPSMLGVVSDSITAADLKTYVEARVAFATGGRQTPTTALGVDPIEEVASLKKAGIPFDTRSVATLRMPFDTLRASRTRGRKAAGPSQSEVSIATHPLDLARRIELENQGEEILLRYLQGDETAQTHDDFSRGARIYQEALSLQPGAPYVMARANFCEGRSLIFEKEYGRAIDLLEDSIRLDPSAAYGYNALGIAYLERANYAMATSAFKDAIQRAPNWAYPRHNLALTYTQMGAYPAAIAQYYDAIRVAPQYSYLHYNLGLTYQKINRTREAAQEYQRARSLAQDRAAPLIALGVLSAGRGSHREAERNYRAAQALLEKHPDPANLLTARHNLAVLLASKRKRFAEAEQLWIQNIQTANYLPSRFSYAEALLTPPAKDRQGRIEEAITQYREILRSNPDQIAPRLRLAEQLAATGRLKDAAMELMEAQCWRGRDPIIYERLGALQERMGQPEDARRSYELALRYCSDANERKRILDRLRR